MRKLQDSKSRYKKFIVDINDFKIIKRLTSGGFGSIYSVQNLNTGETSAAKVINLKGDEEQYKKMVNREIGIMIHCQHPMIVKIKGFSLQDFHGENNVTIFMEFCKKGSLYDFLQKSREGLLDVIFDNTNRQIMLIGIARGMMHLHQHHAIHRDLKPANILLDDNLHPLITDFGLSKYFEVDNSISQSQQCGTSIYMAPEILEGVHYNGKVDVYSFGILMYEIVTDSVPYPLFESHKIAPLQFINKVVYENYRPVFENKVKKSIQKLIEKCWSKNPSERPTFEEIFNKLAYNIQYSVDDVYNDDEEIEISDEENNFYLEDVDENDVLNYADEIDEFCTSNESEINSKLEELIAPIKKENEQMKKKIKDLENVKNENDSLMKENAELKLNLAKYDQMKKK